MMKGMRIHWKLGNANRTHHLKVELCPVWHLRRTMHQYSIRWVVCK